MTASLRFTRAVSTWPALAPRAGVKALACLIVATGSLLLAGAADAHPSLAAGQAAATTTHTLTVTVTGSGSGRVSDFDNKIYLCRTTCTAEYTTGTRVSLFWGAESAASVFTGWSGEGCSGTLLCEVTMDQDRSVTATFAPAVTYTVNVITIGSGSGTVTSEPAGIDCGESCSAAFGVGSSVTLDAVADPGSVFAGWSEDCSGDGTCDLLMDGPKLVEPIFRAPSTAATVDGIGASCAGDDVTATVTAHGDPGSTFTLTLQESDDGTTFTDTQQSVAISVTEAFSYSHAFVLPLPLAASYRVVSGDVTSEPVPASGCAPGTEVPEAPAAMLLPLSLVALFGFAGGVLYVRRRAVESTRRMAS